MRQKLEALLAKEVTRQEFMRLIGVAFLSFVGVTSVLGAVAPKSTDAHDTDTGGFGKGAFGR